MQSKQVLHNKEHIFEVVITDTTTSTHPLLHGQLELQDNQDNLALFAFLSKNNHVESIVTTRPILTYSIFFEGDNLIQVVLLCTQNIS